MDIYFSWARPQDSFSPETHCRHDLPITSLEILEEEGSIPMARAKIVPFEDLPDRGFEGSDDLSGHGDGQSAPQPVYTEEGTGEVQGNTGGHGDVSSPGQSQGSAVAADSLSRRRRESSYRYGFFSCRYKDGIKLLFAGYLSGVPFGKIEVEQELEFLAISDEAPSKVEALVKELKETSSYEPLLVEDPEAIELDEVLEGGTKIPYWSPYNGSLSLVDLMGAFTYKDISENYFEKSLRLNIKQKPFTRVDVQLSVEWQQKATGFLNLSPLLGAQAQGGVVGTLTPNAFKARWHSLKGANLSKTAFGSGYVILQDFLEGAVLPPYGMPDDFPEKLSVVVGGGDGVPPEGASIDVPFHWFRPRLLLSYHYNQKRREVMSFSLHQNLSPAWEFLKGSASMRAGEEMADENLSQENVKYLRLNLGDITKNDTSNFSEEQSCFFETPRGEHVLSHMIERARAYLAASLRAIVVKVNVPIETAISLNLLEGVMLRAPQILGFESFFHAPTHLKGKIIKKHLIFEGDRSPYFAQISFSISVGDASEEGAEEPSLEQGEGGSIFEGDIPQWVALKISHLLEGQRGGDIQSITSESGLKMYFGGEAVFGLEKKDFTAESLVEHMSWAFEGVTQAFKVREKEPFEGEASLVRFLKECPTQANIKLKNLSSKKCLTRHLKGVLGGPFRGRNDLLGSFL